MIVLTPREMLKEVNLIYAKMIFVQKGKDLETKIANYGQDVTQIFPIR